MDSRKLLARKPLMPGASTRRTRRAHRPRLEDLEGRALLATLAPIADLAVPEGLGYQLPLEGGAGGPQTYSVTSSNPLIPVSVARGNFLTIDVTHASSGANDPAFAGSMTFQLFEDLTPLTVERIERLVNQGFYTGKNFHRIANNFPGPNDFIVQGGSVSGTGTGEVAQPGFPFADEFVQQLAFTGAGQLAMANSGDDTNSSQFFVTTGSPRFLDFQHTIFGQLVSGGPTLTQVTQVALNGTTPVTPVLISSASLSPTNPDGVLHIDTSQAPAGTSSEITVTANDPADGSTQTRTFRVTAAENTTAERPFLQPVQNQVVGLVDMTAPVQAQSAVFQLQGVDPNIPPLGLTYVVRGGVSGGQFTNVQNATATVDQATGVVTVTPNAGFTGVINLVVGVGGPNANTTAPTPTDFDTQAITLTVNNGPEVNLPPIALPGTTPVVVGEPSPVQLAGLTGNPESDQTLSFEILTPPTRGTISNFDPQTGRFLYTANEGSLGEDTLTFRVRDVGAPAPNLTGSTAVQTLQIGGGQTGAVRQIGRVLVITPPPSRDSVPNTTTVNEVDGNIHVVVNGLLDRNRPEAAELDRIIFYGSKKDDSVTIGPEVDIPTFLDGGRGGANTLTAGGASTRAHAWFGRSTVTGSPFKDQIFGRAGRFRVLPSGGNDLLFAGTPGRPTTLHEHGDPPSGQFIRGHNGGRVPLSTPERPRPLSTPERPRPLSTPERPRPLASSPDLLNRFNNRLDRVRDPSNQGGTTT